MKLILSVLFAVLVLFALNSEINAASPPNSVNCQGTNDRRCPLKMCGPDGPIGYKRQDNTKPYPSCCGGPICAL